MATFQNKVEDISVAISDTTALSSWLTQGARIVVDILADKRSDKLGLYATAKTDSGSGIGITGGRVISAHKSGYPARRIAAEDYGRATNTGSIHYATATDPAWYILETMGYVKPSGGTLRWVAYPSVAYSDSAVSNFPPEAYDAFVYYAGVQSLMRAIADSITNMATHLTNGDPELVQSEAMRVQELVQKNKELQLEYNRILERL